MFYSRLRPAHLFTISFPPVRFARDNYKGLKDGRFLLTLKRTRACGNYQRGILDFNVINCTQTVIMLQWVHGYIVPEIEMCN